MHSLAWLKRLVLLDVGCSGATTAIGVVCFGPSRTFAWLALPMVFFILGAIAKRQRQYVKYAILHGMWHCLSAAAIALIVLDGGLPWDERLHVPITQTTRDV